MIAEPNKKIKDPFLSWKQLNSWKAMVSLFTITLPISFSLLWECSPSFASGTCTWLPWLQTLNCISLLVLSQPVIAEATSSSPFDLGQQCSLKEYFLHSHLVSIYWMVAAFFYFGFLAIQDWLRLVNLAIWSCKQAVKAMNSSQVWVDGQHALP